MSGLWDKARKAADDARYLFEDERFDAAANRAYYAMFNAARALLLLRGIRGRNVKTHASVLRLFSKEFVANGPFDNDDGRALRLAADARTVADYDDVGVTSAKAKEVLGSMDKFMRVAELTFKRPQGEVSAP